MRLHQHCRESVVYNARMVQKITCIQHEITQHDNLTVQTTQTLNKLAAAAAAKVQLQAQGMALAGAAYWQRRRQPQSCACSPGEWEGRLLTGHRPAVAAAHPSRYCGQVRGVQATETAAERLPRRSPPAAAACSVAFYLKHLHQVHSVACWAREHLSVHSPLGNLCQNLVACPDP
jgi:hypothetical protein